MTRSAHWAGLRYHFNGTALHLATLSFVRKDLETAFRRDFSERSVVHVRIAVVLSIFVYGVFGVLDAWLAPAARHWLWAIRFAWFTPLALVVFALTFTRHYKKIIQPANAALVVAAGLGIIAMILIAPNPASYSYYAGLILVFIYGYTFFKLRFVWAAAAGWTLVVAYEIAAIALSPTPVPVLINNNFFFLTGNVLGMFAGYSIELYARKDFILARRLDEEKRKVDAANLALEERVRERTAQLSRANEDLKREIAERKRSEEKYRTILETMEEAYFEVDLSGALIFFNESTCRILGYPREELMGMNNRGFADPEAARKMFEIFTEVYRTGASARVTDYGIIRKSGEQRIITMSTSLIRDADGNPAGFRGVARDDTERKRAEDQIRRMKDELEDRVAERTAQLNKANAALQEALETAQRTRDRLVESEKMAALGGLVAGVAHEINTPVGVSVTAASLLSEKTEALAASYAEGRMRRSDLEGYLKTASESSASILANLRRAADLVAGFKQVAVDRTREDLRRIKVREYLEQVLASLRPQMKGTGYQTRIEGPAELTVKTDPGALSQVITNLVMNSLTHGFEGRASGEMIIDLSETDGGGVRILYSDDGVGMDRRIVRRIFDPFFTTRRPQGGTGLGMHIVYNLITRRMGGRITCTSVPGEGTVFKITLPAAPNAPSEPQPRPLSAVPAETGTSGSGEPEGANGL